MKKTSDELYQDYLDTDTATPASRAAYKLWQDKLKEEQDG